MGWREHIGIFMVGHGSTGIVSGAENVEYVNEDGAAAAGVPVSFTPAGAPICYPVNTAYTVGFIAYHPYKALSNRWDYAINVQDQSIQSAIDLMHVHATTMGGYTKNSGTVNLQFKHRLVKIVINVTAGDGVSSLSGLKVKITDQEIAGTADLSSSSYIFVTNGTPQDITALTKADGTQAEAILLPGDPAGVGAKFLFELDGVTYEVAVPTPSTAGVWQAKYKYTYNVTLSRNAVEIDGTAQPWLDGGNDTATGYPQ